MKLEFLSNIGDDGKFPGVYPERLIRLYEFHIEEALLFMKAVKNTLVNEERLLALHKLSFIEPINCELTLETSNFDKGILQLKDNVFACCLTKCRYEEMSLLIEPFCNKASGYQWLYEWECTDSSIEFLLSPHGSW